MKNKECIYWMKKIESIKKRINIEKENEYSSFLNKNPQVGARDRTREKIRIRDNHACQNCGRVWREGEKRLDVHHLDCDSSKSM